MQQKGLYVFICKNGCSFSYLIILVEGNVHARDFRVMLLNRIGIGQRLLGMDRILNHRPFLYAPHPYDSSIKVPSVARFDP